MTEGQSCHWFPLSVCCSIASLYNWRYKRLGSLPHVITQPQFRMANPGFMFDFQLINVTDFNGVGESEPNPYFYQVSSQPWGNLLQSREGGVQSNYCAFV